MSQSQQKETQNKKSRLIAYDVARSLAIFGMVIVNYKVVMGASENGPDWLIWFTGLFERRAAATFVILAGVGISMLSRKGRLSQDRERIRQDRHTLLKRAVFLFVVGLLYTPLWPADILHFYGVYIAFAALLLLATDRQLWLGAIGISTAFILLIFIFDYEKGWNLSTLTYVDFWTFSGMVRHIFFNGFHPVIPWLSFILIGMWLGRKDVKNKQVRRPILWISISAAVAAELLSYILITLFPGESGAIFGTEPMPPMPLYIIAGAGTAIAIIILCLELTLRYPNARIFSPLVATRQLALTLYVAHVVIGMGFLEAIGRLENQTLQFATLSTVTFFILGIVFSTYWRKRFQRGPLEWLMRKVTS
ncbi:MAG: DUF418 domain-containing protein [Anaerolineaceae bacterium]|nr:DUF418 domain-containing protein [Anaerolineaceae bacterium]